MTRALDSGQLAGATLDVFEPEPLPPARPFWAHPRILMTPHVASLTDPDASCAQIAENIRRLRAGEPLLHLIDRARAGIDAGARLVSRRLGPLRARPHLPPRPGAQRASWR